MKEHKIPPKAAEENDATCGANDTNPAPAAPAAHDNTFFAPPTASGDLGRLGKYRILKELGRGGMGAVFLAFDERLQRKVALKVMLPIGASNTTAKDRFLREARAAARIGSDFVVNIYEADEIDGIPYIALQFLQGSPLDEYLKKKGSPSLGQTLRIGRETALGLAAAHKLGMVHRDIKPGNIWLEAPNGRVKILDFGLAKLVERSDGTELTAEGAVLGTPAFMAPEQGCGEKVDGRADLFSLGCVLYRLAAGRLPFNGPTLVATLMAIATEEPTPVREVNPELPEAFAGLIHKLMAKNPDNRPATAKEVAAELAAMEKSKRGKSAPLLVQPTPANQASLSQPVMLEPVRRPSPVVGTGAAEATAMLSKDLPATSDGPGSWSNPSPARRSGKKWIIAGAAAFAALAIACVVIFGISKKKDDGITKGNVPDDSPVVVVDPVIPPPATARNAVKFSGTTSYAEIPNLSLAEDKPVTIEAWILNEATEVRLNLKTPNSQLHLMRLDGGYHCLHIPTQGAGKATGVQAHPNAAEGTWSHIAAVVNSKTMTMTFFFDGKPVAVKPSLRTMPNAWKWPSFFGYADANDFKTHIPAGTFAGVRLSQSARYTEEFIPSTRFTADADTLALYLCDEGQGEVLKDSSGHGRDAKLLNAKWAQAEGLLPAKITNSLGMEFALVPKGKSWLGGGGGKLGLQEVEFKQDFYLGVYEVTQAEWEKVMGKNPSAINAANKDAAGIAPEELKRFPVETVSWNDCQEFVKLLNAKVKEPGWEYRLPTQKEWEYACRGGPMVDGAESGFDYYLEKPGNALSDAQANFSVKDLKRTCKVGSYPANRLGLFDMHGNVAEWCSDEIPGTVKKVKGPLPSRRVYRGGGWNSGADRCRVSDLGVSFPLPTYQDSNIGLRLARVPVKRNLADILASPNYDWTPPENLGPGINTAAVEHLFGLTADEKTILFFRNGKPMVSRRASRDVPFPKAEPLPVKLETPAHTLAITGDGLEIAVVLTLPDRGNSGISYCARRSIDEPFGEPVRFPAPINGTATNRHPVYSADGLTLLITSTRFSELRSAEILVFRRDARDKPFGEPVQLPPPVNTEYWDIPVWISDDGRVLLTREQRNSKESISHLWLRPSRDAAFGESRSLDPWMNENTSGAWLSPTGDRLYFNSDSTPDSMGTHDIWMSKRIPKPPK